jgi:hypothetical protein
VSERLRRFASELLEHCGAELQPLEPLDVELLAPPAVQAALGVGELERLHFGASPGPGTRRVGFDGHWLESFAGLLGERGCRRRVVLDTQGPAPAHPEQLAERALDLHNATWRLIDVRPALARVLVFRFAYTAISDDRRVGLLELGLNLTTRSSLGDLLPALLAALPASNPAAPEPTPAQGLPVLNGAEIAGLLQAALPARVDGALAPFVAGLRRRLERDRSRLRSYHQELLDESAQRSARASTALPTRPSAAAQLEREAQRQSAIQRDYRAKLAELETKYALTVELRPVQVLELITPVQRFTLRILRRKRTREIPLDLFPFSPRLEPPPCEYRGAGDRARLACDDAVHLVSLAGAAPCTQCERPFCRVCQPRGCPKCRGRAQREARA